MSSAGSSIPRAPLARALAMSQQMQVLVADADWTGAASVARRLRDSIPEMPAEEQRAALTVLLRATRDLTASVEAARSEISDELCSLRRGQAATTAYRS